jgi:cation diffusion facilitator family transporter
MPMARSNLSIYSALTANIAIAITKFVAGGISGSAAMIAEGVHSLVDSVNELLLLYGIYRSNKERDDLHPFGYGRELYFWSFIVSILILALGAGISFYQGVTHLQYPVLPSSFTWNYIVLAFSLTFEGVSFLIALRAFRKTKGDGTLWEEIRRSKDPTTFVVLFEDGAAVLGVLVVFACLLTGQLTRNPHWDGIASLGVGLLLTAASALLARESRSLLIGEGISARTERAIKTIVEKDPSVKAVLRMFSIYQSPEEVLLVLFVSFRPESTNAALPDQLNKIKDSIRDRYRKITYIIIEPETTDVEARPEIIRKGRRHR